MTPLQKEVILGLLEGGSISGNSKYGYRLKDRSGNPVSKFTYRTFHSLRPHLRMEKGRFVINRKFIRSLSKRYWIKKMYLDYLNRKNEPTTYT